MTTRCAEYPNTLRSVSKHAAPVNHHGYVLTLLQSALLFGTVWSPHLRQSFDVAGASNDEQSSHRQQVPMVL